MKTMPTREDFGWHDDKPCPDWCTSPDHHLDERLTKRMDHFWHRGPKTRIYGTGFVREDPEYVEPCLSQHVIVDERGFNTRPIEIEMYPMEGFTVANARQLGALLFTLAAQADALCNEPT